MGDTTHGVISSEQDADQVFVRLIQNIGLLTTYYESCKEGPPTSLEHRLENLREEYTKLQKAINEWDLPTEKIFPK